MAIPGRISGRSTIWTPGKGQDPARYLVSPGTVRGPGRHSAGNLRHARPYLANGSRIFVFPIGVEGFTRRGTATLGIHKYIGANAVDGTTIHYEEAHIELNGTFPGITAQNNMVDCINMLRSLTSTRGLVLYAPGVFEREQYVLPEDWAFEHEPGDLTHSINFTITFTRIGEGRQMKDPHGAAPPPQPTIKIKPKGKPSHIFTVKDGVRTLRQIAHVVYGTQSKWTKLVDLNKGQLAAWKKSGLSVPNHKLPTYPWPIGFKFRY